MSEALSASIIINNYNYGRFLADAIDSALAQKYARTEVIVVDDGSTDHSRDVIKRYADRVTSVLKDNGGQASAYNSGFGVSRGDIICFLDADDKLAASAVSAAVAAFRNSELIKVEWQLEIIDEVGRRTGELVPEKPLPPVDLRDLTLSDGPFYDWLVTPPSSGNCYRRAMLERVLPMSEAPFRNGADVYLTMLAPIFGKIHRLARPQGSYRTHGRNNYHGRALDDDRLRNYKQRFEDCCVQLSSHLLVQGIDADSNHWKERNFNYLWPTRLMQIRSDIEAVVPSGASYILANDGEWGNDQPVEGRHAVPFLERDGEYWGPPSDDENAIAELKRLRNEKDAAYIVFPWTSAWWLDHYTEFHQWLRSRHPCVLENERLIIFDIRETCEAGVG
jgi:glycosyltransferase involved in cell wall biosynthesis